MALPSFAQTRVFAFGDSLTFGLRDSGVDCSNPSSARGYPAVLDNQLADQGLDAQVWNFGRCGETTAEGLSRLPSVIDEPADVILLMEGTNDISFQIGIESMVFNINEMGRLSQEAGIQPVYGSIVPRGPETSPDTNNTRAAFYTFRLEEEAAARDIPFADPFNTFLRIPNAFDLYYDDDGFHLNSQGYGILASAFVDPTIEAADRAQPEPCVADDTTLCLNDERYKVQVSWRDFDGNTGVGMAEQLTPDTGYFWFFNPENVELTLKALDGRCINEHFWIFFGALSNVEYRVTVTDSETGRSKVYDNPLRNFASVGDTQAFKVEPEDCGNEVALAAAESELSMFQIPAASIDADAPDGTEEGPCVDGPQILCLNERRFELEVDWLTPSGSSGPGKAVGLTPDTGYFWFFNPENVELVVKVLDGREINGNYWVFYGSLSNVEFELTVRDLETDDEVIYFNPQRNFASVGDTTAFPQDP